MKPSLRLQIGVPLTEAVQKALNTVGISSKAVPANKVAGGKHNLDSKSKPSKKQKQANVADAVAQDDVAPAGVSQSGKVASKAVKHSGDDLGDEFDVEVEAAEDEGNQKRKKKKGSLKAGSLKDEKSNKPKAKAHKVIRF